MQEYLIRFSVTEVLACSQYSCSLSFHQKLESFVRVKNLEKNSRIEIAETPLVLHLAPAKTQK